MQMYTHLCNQRLVESKVHLCIHTCTQWEGERARARERESERERERERESEREKEEQGGGRAKGTIVRARESKVGMESKNIVHTPQLLKLRLPPSRQSPNTYVASDAEWRGDQEPGARQLSRFHSNDALEPGICHEHVANRMLLRVLGACIARVRGACQVDQKIELGRELLGLLCHLRRWLDGVAER